MRPEDIMFLVLYVGILVCVIGWVWSVKSCGKMLGDCLKSNRELLDYCHSILASNDNLLGICNDVCDENSQIIDKYNHLLNLIKDLVSHEKGISKSDMKALIDAIAEANKNVCYIKIEEADSDGGDANVSNA